MTDFGKDISCTDSLKTGRYSTGLRLVAEALYRRLITRRGQLIGGEEEAEYGLHVREYLGAVTSTGDAARVQGLIRQELLKDQRIDSVDVELTEIEDGPEREWTIRIKAFTGEGPFSLVLAVSGVTTQMIGFSE